MLTAEPAQGGPRVNDTKRRHKTPSRNKARSRCASCEPAQAPHVYDAWQREMLTSLDALYNSRDTADVCILLGNDMIYAHKLILDINSSIVASQSERNDIQGMLSVDLLDYWEHKETVTNIIHSFYTGSIAIHNDNIKVVYKFAKCYSVTWLIQHTLQLLENMINVSFSDIMKFAHNIKCSNLTEACLIRLNKCLVDTLLESGELDQLDQGCLQTITTTDSICLEEMQIFDLVCKWYDHDPEKRKCYVGKLLSNIRYNLISKDELLGSVYEWISAAPGLEDRMRLDLLIKINKHINLKVPGIVPISREAPPPYSSTAPRPGGPNAAFLPPSDENLLQLIVNSVQNNNSAACTSSEQLMQVLRENFPRANSSTKQCVVEYISDNRLVDEHNVTSLLHTHHITKHQNMALLCVHYIMANMAARIHHVIWEELQPDTCRDVILQLEGGRREYLLAECVMRWCEAHPREPANMRMLLGTLCYSAIPTEYIASVLLPQLQKLLPDVSELTCSRHTSHNKGGLPKPVVICRRVPPELYLVAKFEMLVKQHLLTLNKQNTDQPLRMQPSKFCKKNANICKVGFVLYDADNRLKNYPVSATLKLGKLREIVEKSTNLYFMFIF